ncbi:MAG TPA: OmpA family protein [Blastocatellia bacterium]|nr:OmpA family protein [Blastocatellia bacterium]
MKHKSAFRFLLVVVAAFALTLPIIAQQPGTQPNSTPSKTDTQSNQQTKDMPAASKGQVSSGQKQEVNGIVLRREGDTLTVRSFDGKEYNVVLNDATKIRERKSNPFRGAKKYSPSDLTRGLTVEVEGRGNDAGALVANKIQFSEAELRTASSIVSMVTPVEGRVTTAEERLTQSEQNAQRLSGQIDELVAVANTAKGGAAAAQETADKAMAAANSANERITQTAETLNNRIASLDDYEVAKTITLNFKVGSAKLSPEAKAALDEIAAQAKTGKGHMIQIAGFASADGNETVNRRLSQRRAEAVMSYLIENHDISQRRLVTPAGYGEARPAGDNTTREGRKENRRVEVAILVSKGLSNTNTATSQLNQQQQQQ